MSKAQRACMVQLWQQCLDFLRSGSVDVDEETHWHSYLRSVHVTYSGDFTAQAERLRWVQVKAGLPPPACCGVVRAIDVCEGAALEFIQAPRLRLSDVDSCPKAGVVHASPSELCPLIRNLLQWGIVAPVRKRDLIMIQGRPVLNGMFALPKVGTEVCCEDGQKRPAQRLIMDLRAGNSLLDDFTGDVATLPSLHRWRSICLDPSEGLLLSYEDLKGCFYLVALEASWHSIFAFNAEFWAWDLGLQDRFPENERIHVGAAVCPMGWKAAVGLIQYIHRRILGQPSSSYACDSIPSAGLPLQRELRADRCIPFVSGRTASIPPGALSLAEAWQVYVDDWDMLEVIELAEFDATIASGCHRWQQQARALYASLSMPTSVQKAGVRERVAMRLGVHVDGNSGRLVFPAAKCARVLGLVLHSLPRRLTRKQVQIVLGHLVHGMVLRRESLTCLHRSWRLLRRPASLALPIPEQVKREWLVALLHLPLLQINLRAQVSPVVVASDASEYAAGACASTRLNAVGRSKLSSPLVLHPAKARDALLLITLYEETGLIASSLLLLGVELAAHVAVAGTAGGIRLHGFHFPLARVIGNLVDVGPCVHTLLMGAPHVQQALIVSVAAHRDAFAWAHMTLKSLAEEVPWLVCDLLTIIDADWSASWALPMGLQACHRPCRGYLDASALELPVDYLQRALSVKDAALVPGLRESLIREVLLTCTGSAVTFERLLQPWAAQWQCQGEHWSASETWETDMVKALLTHAASKGSDVRLSTQTVTDPRAWPRHSMSPEWWDWRVILSFRVAPQHINILELQALFASIRWRLRTASNVGMRCLHAVDSQVALAAVVKGRSSSNGLHGVLKRLNATVLASNLLVFYTYVHTSVNPADRPSRWREWSFEVDGRLLSVQLSAVGLEL
eukprot:6458421-Amphidinium_carterae.2